MGVQLERRHNPVANLVETTKGNMNRKLAPERPA